MKTLFENITSKFGSRIVEYNGHKFKMYLESTSSMPCAKVGYDWYHSLSIMLPDGTFAQITDAEEIGSSVNHYHCAVVCDFTKLCQNFENYIKKVY